MLRNLQSFLLVATVFLGVFDSDYALSQHHDHDIRTTSDYVIVHGEVIPRFAKNPNFLAAKSGSWSDPATWSNGIAPAGADARVQIPSGVTVEYDLNSTAPIDAIEVNGKMAFRTDVSTSLWLNELTVMPTGELEIGTSLRPILDTVRAEIVFTNTPDASGRHFKTGTDAAPGIDPQQWGKGLLVLGKITVHGAVRSSSYIRLKTEPLAGASFLDLSTAPIGWKTGDTVILPDTQPRWADSRIERLRIRSIEGTRIGLENPLKVTHFGAQDGTGNTQYLPHVGNLDRNVVFRSESPAGVRGHTVCFGRAAVDIRYARFSGLGRTTSSNIDNGVVTFSGDLLKSTRIGGNQVGRYPVHMHHVEGPVNPSNEGYQFQLVGNSVDNGLRWGMVVHGSNYGNIKNNFVFDVAGAGIVTEDGSEAFNVFDGNFVVKASGRGFFKAGLAGQSFWFRGPLNTITNNVAANANREAYAIFVQNLGNKILRPKFRGANKMDASQVTNHSPSAFPFFNFKNNEVYSAEAAFDSWTTGPLERAWISQLTAWHTNDNNFVISSYSNRNVSIDNFVVRGFQKGLNPKNFQKYQPIPSVGIQAVRESSNLAVSNSSILGVQVGIESPAHRVERMTVSNTEIQAYIGMLVRRLNVGGSHNSAPDTEYGSLVVENTRFLPLPHNTKEPTQYSLHLRYDTSFSTRANLMAKHEIFLIDFNGVSGANYQLYYLEQAPDFIVPQSVAHKDPRMNFTASPEAGLTNQQVWDKYGIALAGGVAPCKEVDGDNCQAARKRGEDLRIHGLAFPLTKDLPKPEVDAGADFSLPKNVSFNLAGRLSPDTVGEWSKFEGPGEVTFSNYRASNSSVRFSDKGEYLLRFTATRGPRRAFDEVRVVVQ